MYTLEPLQYGNLISQKRATTTSYYLYDGLGSTDRLTNASAAETDNYIYEAFGTTKASSGTTANSFRFVGRHGYYWNSDTDDYWIRARSYSPAAARFMSADPLFHRPAWQYQYAANNPSNRVDPSGLQSLEFTKVDMNPCAGFDVTIGITDPSEERSVVQYECIESEITRCTPGCCKQTPTPIKSKCCFFEPFQSSNFEDRQFSWPLVYKKVKNGKKEKIVGVPGCCQGFGYEKREGRYYGVPGPLWVPFPKEFIPKGFKGEIPFIPPGGPGEMHGAPFEQTIPCGKGGGVEVNLGTQKVDDLLPVPGDNKLPANTPNWVGGNDDVLWSLGWRIYTKFNCCNKQIVNQSLTVSHGGAHTSQAWACNCNTGEPTNCETHS